MEGQKTPQTIIQLYVPGSTKGSGINSSYAQQYEQLQDQGTEFPDVMKQYYADLHQLLEKHSANHVVMMGDFNEAPDGANVLNLQCQHNLRDAFLHKHPGIELNTQQSGSKQIDFFLVLAQLLPEIQSIGYEPVGGSIPSDHRGMYMNLSVNILKDVAISPTRKLNSNHRDQVKTYRANLYEAIVIYRITEDLHELKRVDILKNRKQKHTKRLIQVD